MFAILHILINWFYCSTKILPSCLTQPIKTFYKTTKEQKGGVRERGSPSWCSIYTSIPIVAVSLCCSLRAREKTQQSGSIRSLFVWLYSSQQGYSRCCITQGSGVQNLAIKLEKHLFLVLWNSGKERREGNLCHCVFCNNTLPPVRVQERRESQWYYYCPFLSLFSFKLTVET